MVKKQLIPLIFLLAFIIIVFIQLIVQGPFYLHQNGDMNYVYMLAGLDYTHGLKSNMIDHPGIPTKLVNGLFALLSNQETIYHESESETFIRTVVGLTSVLIGFCYYKFLLLTAKYCKSSWHIILVGLSFFLSSVLLLNLVKNSPDPYLIVSALWISILWIKNRFQGKSPWLSLGLALSFGIFSKIIFLPMILIVMAFEMKMMDRIKSIFTVLFISIVAFFWHIENGLRFFRWFSHLVKKDGRLGSGTDAFLASEGLLDRIAFLFTSNPMFWIALIVIFVLVRKSKNNQNRNLVFVFGLVTLVLCIFILKHPSRHYFTYLYAFLPLLFFAALHQQKTSKRALNMLWVLCMVFLVFRVYSYSKTWSKYSYKSGMGLSEDQLDYAGSAQSYYFSSPEYAWFLAHRWQYHQNNQHQLKLHQAYPDARFYVEYLDEFKLDHWINIFCNFKDELPPKIGQVLTITGTTRLPEMDQNLEILEKTINGKVRHYKVKVLRLPLRGHEETLTD